MIEFGWCGRITEFEGQSWGASNRSPDVASGIDFKLARGPAIQGYAARFMKLHEHKGRVEVFTPGAFDRALSSKSLVSFLIDHERQNLIGTTADRLQLKCDETGLAFRIALPNAPIGERAMSMIERGERVEMSASYVVRGEETQNIDGTDIRILRDVLLNEISLVRTGACPGTYASLIDVNAKSWEFNHETTASLGSDYAFQKIRSSLRNITRALEQCA